MVTDTVKTRKTRPSKGLLKRLKAYYQNIAGGTEYLEGTWTRWKDDPDVVFYSASTAAKKAGWAIYNVNRSTILEVVVVSGFSNTDVESAIIDAIVERETLIAVEIPEPDMERYGKMIEYGFRPTRTFNKSGMAMLRMELCTSVLLGKLKGKSPRIPYRRKEPVVIEKVAQGEADMDIKAGLLNIFKKLGGIGKFVKKGQSVVIKPNIVSDHGLKEGKITGGIVTDIRVVRALTEILLPVAGKITIAEGSSINRSATTTMFSHYGYNGIVELDLEKIRLIDLNSDKQVEKKVPGGRRMTARKIPVTLDEADVIINLPVLKIHFAAIVSLSIKSLQGAVYPLEKYMSHFFGLWQSLVNIHYLIKPQVTIIDGITGQEDFGPISGTPKKMNLLIGGTNPVAVDSVAMRIMGIDPAASPPVFLAYMQGLGPLEMDNIKVMGPPIETVRSAFKQPWVNMDSGRDIAIHDGNACPGCRGYLHFVLNKLRRPDPLDETRSMIDRPFAPKVNIYLGPETNGRINPEEVNIFMGLCQQHHKAEGRHLPGCPPHAEVILDGIYALFPGMEKPKYADKSEEARLGEMLDEILSMQKDDRSIK